MSKVNTVNTVTINELRKVIPAIGGELTPVIQSEPGCGKTSLLNMMREDLGDDFDYIYVDCPVKDMSDIAMTIPNHETQTLESYVGSLFKLDSPKPKVILLDEFMKSPKLLQVIFTRLMLERCVGDTPLPEGSIVFATSNNASDGVGDSMLAHAGNRVCRVRMQKPNHEEWGMWATANGISRVIRTFVAMYPRCLASYHDGGQENNSYIFKPGMGMLSFVSPRSLAKSDVIVRNRDVLGPTATHAMLAGTIGASAAGDMAAFLLLDKSVTDVRDIVKDPSIPVPNEVAAQLMVIFQAVDVLETHEELNEFMKWVNRVPSSEVQSIFMSQMCRVPRAARLARRNEAINKWSRENHVLFG